MRRPSPSSPSSGSSPSSSSPFSSFQRWFIEANQRFQNETPKGTRYLLLFTLLVWFLDFFTTPPTTNLAPTPGTPKPLSPLSDVLSYTSVISTLNSNGIQASLIDNLKTWFGFYLNKPWSATTSMISPEKGLIFFLIVAYMGKTVLGRHENENKGTTSRFYMELIGVTSCINLLSTILIWFWYVVFPLGVRFTVVESFSSMASLVVALTEMKGQEEEDEEAETNDLEIPLFPFVLKKKFQSFGLAFFFGLFGGGSVDLLVAIFVGRIVAFFMKRNRTHLFSSRHRYDRLDVEPVVAVANVVEAAQVVSQEEKRKLIQSATDKRLQMQQQQQG